MTGLRIAGGQGIAIIAFCQARHPGPRRTAQPANPSSRPNPYPILAGGWVL